MLPLKPQRNFLSLVFTCFLVAWLSGQTGFSHAQSDPSNFTTVIDAPPTIIGQNESISSNTQLNVSEDDDVRFEVGAHFSAGNESSTNIEINVSGGGVNFDFAANNGAMVNLSGGFIGVRSAANFGSIVNISGGQVSNQFNSNSGSTVNISGGKVGAVFDANSGSTVNLSGGTVGRGFDAFSGSRVTISGGTVGPNFNADFGSAVTFVGGEFLLNGVTPTNLASVTLVDTDVLTGTLEDGSVFIFSTQGGNFGGDNLNGVTLQDGSLQTIDLTPKVISGPVDPTPTGLRAGQSLTLQGSGVLRDNFAAVNATLDVQGGSVGESLQIVDSEVTISGGSVGGSSLSGGFDAFTGSTVNISGGLVTGLSSSANSGSSVSISGGDVRSNFVANSGSTVHISGGTVFSASARSGSLVQISGGSVGFGSAGDGSTVNMSGGTVAGFFRAETGSNLRLSGGTVAPGFHTELDSAVTFVGGEFLVNGVAPANPVSFSLRGNDLLTGTLEDGSVFVFSPQKGDVLNGVTFQSATLPTLDLTPIVVSTSTTPAPSGLRTGQFLTLQGSGVLRDNFAAIEATLHVEEGSVGNNLEVVGSTVNIAGGSVGGGFSAFSSSAVHISDGAVGSLSVSNSTANISGGSVGDLLVSNDSTIEMTGGSAGNFFSQIDSGGTLNLAGGTILAGGAVSGTFFSVDNTSAFNLFGTELFINGVPVEGLLEDIPLTITEREGEVSGLLADGSIFSFDLFSFMPTSGGTFIHPDATFTFTLVESIAGDFNNNDITDGADFLSWQRGQSRNIEALTEWQNNFGDFESGDFSAVEAAAIPEPSSVALASGAALVAVGMGCCQKRLR